jgi:transposase
MKMHANAMLSLKGRELLVDRVERAGWSLIAAAEAAGISDRTARKWLGRYRAEGRDGLLDRSSAPVIVANRTDERRIEVVAALRRLRMTGVKIAESLDMALSTVSGILARIGMGKLGRLGLEPAQRYERARPGELIHIDVKKLGRIHDGAGHRFTGKPGQRAAAGRRADAAGVPRLRVGWEYVPIVIDDATRLAYVEVLANEKAITARRIPAPRRRALRQLRHHHRATDHRQRQRLPIHRPRDRLPDTRHPTPPHAALPTPDQRQSRTIHQNHARRLGLRRDLPRRRRAQRRARRLA